MESLRLWNKCCNYFKIYRVIQVVNSELIFSELANGSMSRKRIMKCYEEPVSQ